LEPTALVSTVHAQEVIVSKLMPGFLVEKESSVDKQQMVMSMLDPTTTTDDDISLAGKHDKEDNAQEFLRQGQAEIHATEASYSQCKTGFENVSIIVTSDDLAPDIGRQEMSENAARGANDNDADTIGYEKDEEQKFLTCVTKSNAPGMIEPSISMVKVKVPSKCPISPQNLNTFVPYKLLTTLPPHVEMLICEAHKVETW